MNIKKLLKLCPNGFVKGIDYSPVSVAKANKVNRGAVSIHRCVVLQGNVADMIFVSEWFDAVTAFETVYFWPDLLQSFKEVYRVLKSGGTFLICNECSGDNAEDEKWAEKVSEMIIYKDVQLKAILEQAGFHVELPAAKQMTFEVNTYYSTTSTDKRPKLFAPAFCYSLADAIMNAFSCMPQTARLPLPLR